MNEFPIVMICETGHLARAVQLGAYASWLEYDKPTGRVTELFFNDDFEFMEDE